MPLLKNILHVDDEPDVRELIALSLELGGLIVQSCACGQDAIKLIQTFSPDLMILDVMMPGLDGPATLKALRAEPNGQAPAIFMTAKGMQSEIARLRRHGAVDVIAKPFDPVTLSERVRGIWQAAIDSPDEQDASNSGTQLDETGTALAALQTRFHQRLEATHELLARFLSAERRKDWLPTLRDSAHKLAGSGGTFGYPDISALASALERAAEESLDGHDGSLDSAVASLQHRLAVLIARPAAGVRREASGFV